MRILVTGATGYIGERLIETLREKDWVERIIGLDIRESPLRHTKLRFVRRDIREPLDDLFTTDGIDAVAHLAFVVPPIHDKGLMEEINKGGLRNTLDAAARAGVKQILHASSTTAYGFHPDNDKPLTEESVRFYQEMFGGEIIMDGEVAGSRNVLLRLGSGHINFYDQPPKDDGRGVLHHLGIRADDLEGLVRHMETKGFCFRKGITDLGALKYVMAAAPDGVLLELFETTAL